MVLHFMITCLFTIIIIAMGTTTLQAGSNNSSSSMSNIAKPGCPAKCGDVTVPYPFGIGEDCSLDYDFYLICNTSSDSHKTPQLFLGPSETRIHSISSDSEVRIFTGVTYKCYHQDGNVYSERSYSCDLRGIFSVFTFSEKNNFTVIGCDDYDFFRGIDNTIDVLCNEPMYSRTYSRQCSTITRCSRGGSPKVASTTVGLEYYNLTFNSDQNHTGNPCRYAFLGEKGSFKFNRVRDLSNNASSEVVERIESTVPVVLDWSIPRSYSADVCRENSERYGVEMGGYRCRCNKGYQGNAYLEQGCQDINECEDPRKYPCDGTCNNTLGSYNCTCLHGYVGDAKVANGCQRVSSNFPTGIFISGILALLVIVMGLLGLYFMAQKRKQVKLREKYYEQNGGALLKDKLKTKGGVDVSSINIYRVEELKKATDNFAESNVLGKGGNGTVYKGTLTDGRLVAIKKSQRVDQGQREEFINEMVILTQINHTNVVQLIGFCLETEVPLLAYEFVSNNTLYHHIHNKKTGSKRLSWDTRLRIAHESAGALAYIHTDTRMSIIHRDVKSTNILLDENYTAKIADFGASRLVPLGHDEVTTLVQGTLGYLDPEYFQSGHLTDRSDVYSFGVVLAELLTGQQPLNVERCPEERNLATYFVKAVMENKFLDILEHGVVKEAGYEQLKAISDLVCRCLNLVGANRPSMKEVTMEIDTLRKLGKPTNSVSEDNYNETSSLMIEMETTDSDTLPPMPTSDTIEDSSITSEMQDMMLHTQSAR